MSNKRALQNQQHKYRVIYFSKLSRSLILLLATVLSFSAVSLMAADQLLRANTFVVDKLKIKGRFVNLQPQQIEQVVRSKLVGNFFALELADIKAAVESIDWVYSANVRRQWPDSLLVHVTEYKPVMRWNNNQWVTVSGEVINLPNVSIDNPIKLMGNDKDAKLMLNQAYRWQQQLAKNNLQLVKLSLSDSYAWQLDLIIDEQDKPFKLMLGSHDIEQRFERFQTVYHSQFKQTDANNNTLKLQRIDARYPDGLAIQALSQPAVLDQLADVSQ